MSLFTTVRQWLFGGPNRVTGEQFSGPSSYADESASPVTFDTAMQLSAVWACVKLLAETVASLPLTIWKIAPSGRKPAALHEVSLLFAGKVNRYQNKIEFFETVLLNLMMHGNSYCLIQRAGDRLVGLLPIMSSQVQVTLLSDGAVVYEYHTDKGVAVYAAESIWHVKVMGNGIVGLSPLAYQRNTLGVAQAAENAVTKIYRNGAKPSGVLSLDKFLTPEQRTQIRSNFASLTTGSDDRLMVLEGGMKFDKVSMTPEDVELLSSRQFQTTEICRWYGVPSVMVNDTSGTTVWGSGITQIVEGFYKVTLRPLLEKLEASILLHLVRDTTGKYEVEFDFEGLLRADFKARLESYRIGIAGGIMKPNEARRAEGWSAVEGGDTLFMQGAMSPIERLANPPEPVVPVDSVGGPEDANAPQSDTAVAA